MPLIANRRRFGSTTARRLAVACLAASLLPGLTWAEPRRELLFSAYPFDPLTDTLPRIPELQLDDVSGPALTLVQLTGPIREAWLARLRDAGAVPVQPIARYGYLVWADDAARDALAKLAAGGDVVRWSGLHPPFLKLGPRLHERLELLRRGLGDPQQVVPVVIQRYRHPGDATTVAWIGRLAVRERGPWAKVLAFADLEAEVRLADVAAIARRGDVSWIGERWPAELFDEVQDQILAGQLTPDASGPSFPGYLDFLLELGFGTDPAAYPLVDVTDDGLGDGTLAAGDATLHELGELANPTRVAYITNCTALASSGSQGGHGHLNLNLVGGFDDRPGFPFLDPEGFNRGLGTSPFTRLGATKIFDPFLINLSGCGGSFPALIATLENQGVQINSNSWGTPGVTLYDADSQAYDAGARDADPGEAGNQELVFVFAPGNAGPDPATVGSPGNAKNVITVGASENFRPADEDGPWNDGCLIGPDGADHAMDVIEFSSRGPAPGGRFKPELIAPGTHVQGTASTDPLYTGSAVCDPYRPGGQTVYAASSGTSHSTPAVAGVASLVHYWLEHGPASGPAPAPPSPAMVKAYLMAHTTYLTGEGAGDTLPSNSQGYGMPNMEEMFDDTARLLVDQTVVLDGPGESWTFAGGVADEARPLRVVLTYTDAPGAIGTSPQVNDLNLEVDVDGTLYRGNVFSGPWSQPGGTADAVNNSEAVFLPAGTTGPLVVTVAAVDVAGDGVPGSGDGTDQDFALVCVNCVETPDFRLETSLTPFASCLPDDAHVTVYVVPIFGFAEPVSLSVAGAPAGTTVSFSPNPAPPGATSLLTISGTGAAAPGSYALQIEGTAGALARSRDVTLRLFDAVPPAGTLLSPKGGAVLQPLLPTFSWQALPDATHYRFQLGIDPGFHPLLVNAPGLKSPSFELSTPLIPNVRYFWKVRTTNSCGTAPFPPVSSFLTRPAPGGCGQGTAARTLYADDMETGAPGWTSSGVQDSWGLSTARAHSGSFAYHAGDPPSVSDQLLVSPPIALPTGEAPLALRFYNYQAIESRDIGGCWDGAVLEISTDGGGEWTRLEPELLTDRYDGRIAGGFGNPLAGENAWCGEPQDWLESIVALDAFAGQTVRFRFRLASDGVGSAEGWYVDDVVVQSCEAVPAEIFADGFESGDLSAWLPSP